MNVQVKKHLITVEKYDQMIIAGVFNEDNRLELIGGEIIEMSPIGIPHVAYVNKLNNLFSRHLLDEVIVSVQNPINLDTFSEPEPDIALLQPRDDFYTGGLAEPEDIFLLIEVADTSLEYDRTIKLPRYAQAGIMEVWIVNLNDQQVEIYRRPSPTGYLKTAKPDKNQPFTPLAFPHLELTTQIIFGP
ncbi:MAG: Uma2 family endonuclease [Chloroflexi bacterium]|nr:Uma2 family endonuclease [Chloroflexota bacterium]